MPRFSYPASVLQSIGRQRLIVYEVGDETKVYASAYDDDESKRQVVECTERYGKGCRTRTVYADQYAPPGA